MKKLYCSKFFFVSGHCDIIYLTKYDTCRLKEAFEDERSKFAYTNEDGMRVFVNLRNVERLEIYNFARDAD